VHSVVQRRSNGEPRKRRPGAGRPRKSARTSSRPITEEIVAAASRLFADRGIGATTMAEIATAVGLQVSSLYYYFGSKAAILEELVAEVNKGPLEHIARIDAEGGHPAVRLHRFIRHDARTLCELPFDINEVHRLAGQDETAFDRYWEERQRLNDAVEGVVAAGVADGTLVTDDPRFTALTILAADEAVQNWFRPVGSRRLRTRDEAAGGDYGADEIGLKLADLALRGLLRDPADFERVRREALAMDDAPEAPPVT
jgi:AcrR family transcriptional regulator